MNTYGVRHNDLHFGNILIDYKTFEKSPKKFLFKLTNNPKDWYMLNVSCLALIYDWDLSSIPKIGNNIRIDRGYDTYGISNNMNPSYDLYKFLCQMRNITGNTITFVRQLTTTTLFNTIERESNNRGCYHISNRQLPSPAQIITDYLDVFKYNGVDIPDFTYSAETKPFSTKSLYSLDDIDAITAKPKIPSPVFMDVDSPNPLPPVIVRSSPMDVDSPARDFMDVDETLVIPPSSYTSK